jgi:hypothetical protein
VETLNKLGFVIHPEKSELKPKHELTFLGFKVNSLTMAIHLPDEKADKIITMCEALIRSDPPVIRKVAELIGTLVSVYIAVPLAPLYTRQLEIEEVQALKANRGNYEARMRLTEGAISDLKWFIGNVRGSYKPMECKEPDKTIWTDASGLKGFGCVDDHGNRAQGQWIGHEIELHINNKELLAVFYGLKSLCRDDSNIHIRIMSDNVTTVSYVRKMGGIKSRKANDIAKDIWTWAEERNIWLSAAHIPGKHNSIADEMSRKFDSEKEWQLNPGLFQKLIEFFPKLESSVDMFATRANKQRDRFISWKPDPDALGIDAFMIKWRFDHVYCFPPFSMVGRTLRKFREEKAEEVIVAPLWERQFWFPTLLSMLVGTPVGFRP